MTHEPMPGKKQFRLLMIDDDASLNRLLVEYFDRFGHKLATATTAAHGRYLLRRDDPDLLITSDPAGPTEANFGGSATVSMTIKNQGTGPTTGPFDVTVYLSNDTTVGDADDVFLTTSPSPR